MSSEQELIHINNIYSSNGSSKNDWSNFIKDINNDSYVDKIIFLLHKYMRENPKNELTVDIIDLIIDYGSPKILFKVADKQFLDTFLNLLKSGTNAGIENQKKVIYLTQKWAKKYEKNKSLSIFMENYNFLKSNGITFPNEDFVINTYTKFISEDEIKNSLYNNNPNSNINLNQNQNQSNNNNNFNNSNNNQNFPNNNNEKVKNPFESMNPQNNPFPMSNNDSFPNTNSFPSNDNFPGSNSFPNNNNFPTNNNFPNNNNFNNSNFGQNNYNNNNPYNNYNNNNPYNNSNNNMNSNPYNNNFSYNNMNNNFSNNNSDPVYLCDMWRQKLNVYNGYIGEGKFSYHANKLKEGIKEILDSFSTIDNAMNNCFNDNSRMNLSMVKSDMEQTVYRYECLKNDKKVEPFHSAFDGNSRKYFFNAQNLFSQKEYIPYSRVEQENQVISGLEKFGTAIKEGAFFVGNKIKDAAVGGYDFVKEKWDNK